jgi:hypothetical protein
MHQKRREKPLPKPSSPAPHIRKRISGLFSRALKAGKAEARYAPLKRISRRSALARIGIGTAAIGASVAGAKRVAKRIPFWLGATRKYAVVFSFREHITAPSAQSVVDEIRKAKERGEPFHVFFAEGAFAADRTFDQTVRGYNDAQPAIAQQYHTLRKRGLTDPKARERIASDLVRANPTLDPFQAYVLAELSLQGILYIPLEKHTMTDAKRILEANTKANEMQMRFEEKMALGQPLTALQSEAHEIARVFNEIEPLRMKAFKDIKARFEDAKRLYPELAKHDQIRAFGHLGPVHRDLYFNFDPLDKDVHLSEVQPDYRRVSFTTYAYLTRRQHRYDIHRESRLNVLGRYTSDAVRSLRETGNHGLADEIFDKGTRMRQPEFEELSRRTEKIADQRARSVLILNYILGRNQFN